jgi:hypothetical protein
VSVDLRIQSLAREVRANPGDLERARGYRSALLRLAEASPLEAHPRLVALEGALRVGRCWGEEGQGKGRVPLRWERVGLGDRPLLEPRLPASGRLTPRWRADGQALWLADGVVLLEAPDGALEGRDAQRGELLWRVPSLRASLAHLDEEERASVLPWVVASWGAVEVVAHHHAPLEYRRVGRHHTELGRVTHREPVDRLPADVTTALQVVVPGEGAWPAGRAAPEVAIERAEHGQGLADSDLALESWDDDLLALTAAPRERAFAVSWRDEAQDWTVFLVGGDDAVPVHVGPAPWSPGAEDPFPPVGVDPFGAPRVSVDGGSLMTLAHAQGHDGPKLLRADGDGPWEPWPGGWAAQELSDALAVLPWFRPALEASEACVRWGVAAGQLFAQRGRDELVAYGLEGDG